MVISKNSIRKGLDLKCYHLQIAIFSTWVHIFSRHFLYVHTHTHTVVHKWDHTVALILLCNLLFGTAQYSPGYTQLPWVALSCGACYFPPVCSSTGAVSLCPCHSKSALGKGSPDLLVIPVNHAQSSCHLTSLHHLNVTLFLQYFFPWFCDTCFYPGFLLLFWLLPCLQGEHLLFHPSLTCFSSSLLCHGPSWDLFF